MRQVEVKLSRLLFGDNGDTTATEIITVTMPTPKFMYWPGKLMRPRRYDMNPGYWKIFAVREIGE